ncbi:MAG: hypothetical protein ACRBFS_11935 [Aureispira sp.]
MEKIKFNKKLDTDLNALIQNLLIKYSSQLFISKGDSYTPYGTGVFVQLGGNGYILTSSSVSSLIDQNNSLYIRLGKTSFISTGTVAVEGNLNEVKAGLSYIKLSSHVKKILTHAYCFLPISDFRAHHQLLNSSQYCIIGYPKKNIIKADDSFKTGASCFVLPPSLDEKYSTHHLNKQISVSFDLERDKPPVNMFNKEPVEKISNLYGIEGAPIWQILVTQLEEEALYLLDFRLIGVVTNYIDKNDNILVGARIETILYPLTNNENIKIKRKKSQDIELPDFLFQKEGIINRYNPKIHSGKQPIRVLHHMNSFMFNNTHPTFSKDLMEAFENFGLKKQIALSTDNELKGPYIDGNKVIHLRETFLSYLWCMIHSVYVLYIEKINHPLVNKHHGKIIHEISEERIERAIDLFQYGTSLKLGYTTWFEDLPNPEKYDAKERDFIEQPNCFYTEAVKFILAHEYTHAIKHIDDLLDKEKNGIQSEKSYFLEYEKEADYDAIELLKKGIFPSQINKLAIELGIILGILAIFYLKPNTSGEKHPNTEDRLVDSIEQLDLEDEHHGWGIACSGLQLWIEQFSLKIDLKIDEDTKNFKDIFYDVIKQIKKLN